jgi:hypothetical protein
MIWTGTLLATGTLLSPTKKRTLFSRLPLSEPTINTSHLIQSSLNYSEAHKADSEDL